MEKSNFPLMVAGVCLVLLSLSIILLPQSSPQRVWIDDSEIKVCYYLHPETVQEFIDDPGDDFLICFDVDGEDSTGILFRDPYTSSDINLGVDVVCSVNLTDLSVTVARIEEDTIRPVGATVSMDESEIFTLVLDNTEIGMDYGSWIVLTDSGEHFQLFVSVLELAHSKKET